MGASVSPFTVAEESVVMSSTDATLWLEFRRRVSQTEFKWFPVPTETTGLFGTAGPDQSQRLHPES